jgi:hypothetical protein
METTMHRMHTETCVPGVWLSGPLVDGSYVLSAPDLNDAVRSFKVRPTKRDIKLFESEAWSAKFTRKLAR